MKKAKMSAFGYWQNAQQRKCRRSHSFVVYKRTVLASETKSYCVSLPGNMNNKNSVCKLVSSFPKKYIPPVKNSPGVNLRF